MIAGLSGIFERLDDAPNKIYVTTSGGVVYEVECNPSLSLSALGDTGLWVWQVFAEDQQTMYGFASRRDRSMAMKIREVPGMGPVSSARLVQAVGADQVLAVISSGDAKALARLSAGLGPKRAQGIIAALQPYARTQSPGVTTPPLNHRLNKMVNAAMQLGISVNQQLMTEVLRDNEELDDSNVFAEYMKSV